MRWHVLFIINLLQAVKMAYYGIEKDVQPEIFYTIPSAKFKVIILKNVIRSDINNTTKKISGERAVILK